MAAWSLFRQVLPYLLLGAGIGTAIYGLVPDDLIIKVASPGNLPPQTGYSVYGNNTHYGYFGLF